MGEFWYMYVKDTQIKLLKKRKKKTLTKVPFFVNGDSEDNCLLKFQIPEFAKTELNLFVRV